MLHSQSIPTHKLVQYAGEFVLTFPGAYHQGYNCGFNGAESVNFAFENWIEMGLKAKYCDCESESVRLDVAALLAPGPMLSSAITKKYIAAGNQGKSLPKMMSELSDLPTLKVFNF